MAGIAFATIAAVALGLAHTSGLLTPRPWLEVRAVQFHAGHTVTEALRVHNQDWFDETLTGLSSATPGVTARARSLPSIPRSGSVLISVTFRVIDCRLAARTNDPMLRLTIHRPWGAVHKTVTVEWFDLGSVAGPLVRTENLFMDGVFPWSCQH